MRRFELRLDDGSWRNIALGAQQVADYLGPSVYVGMTIGRYANRIAHGRFSLDGCDHQLDANDGPNCLHGGSVGFHAHVWDVLEHGEDWAVLSLTSPDGDQGFPGEVRVTARYEVIEGGAQVEYRAVTSAPTVFNVTTHPYFNMNGEGRGDVDEHRLTVHASRWTPTGQDGIPTGEIREVAGSALDFRHGRVLGAAREEAAIEGITIKGGFDHNFVVDGAGMREHCRLTGPDGASVTVISDQPALQVYGGDHFDGSQVGTGGLPYQRRAGIALETQHYPDSPNRPGFPSTVLRPGREWATTTRWMVGGPTR